MGFDSHHREFVYINVFINVSSDGSRTPLQKQAVKLCVGMWTYHPIQVGPLGSRHSMTLSWMDGCRFGTNISRDQISPNPPPPTHLLRPQYWQRRVPTVDTQIYTFRRMDGFNIQSSVDLRSNVFTFNAPIYPACSSRR